MADLKRILIVGPAWIGDMVMAQSLFKVLREQYPQVAIDVLAPAWSAPILKRMPEVRRHIEIPLAHGEFGLGVRYRLGKQLRAEGYDQAIVIPRSWKAALVPFFARIPQRTGYKGEMRYGLLNDIRPLDKSVLSQTVQRYVALGLLANAESPPAYPTPELRVNSQSARNTINEFNLSLGAPILALCPGAEYGPAKCWPPEYFASVARTKLAEGWQVWVLGSAKERVLAEKMTHMAPGCVNLVGKTTLDQAIDILSQAGVILSNDSGLMHVAAALKRSLVAIYGSSDPAYTPPLSEKVQIEYLALDCSPCFARTCQYGHYRCLKDIKPEQVLKTIADDIVCSEN